MSSATKSQQAPPATLKKSMSGSQSGKNQMSIAGFFKKQSPTGAANASAGSEQPSLPSHGKLAARGRRKTTEGSDQSLTPAPSSDAVEIPDNSDFKPLKFAKDEPNKGLPSPVTPAGVTEKAARLDGPASSQGFYSPSRKAKKIVSYAESGSDDNQDEEDVFDPSVSKTRRSRSSKRRKVDSESDDDAFIAEPAGQSEISDEDDFIVNDDSDPEAPRPKKRKRQSAVKARQEPEVSLEEAFASEDDIEIPATSTAQQWTFDPLNVQPLNPRVANGVSKHGQTPVAKKLKGKVHTTDPEKRYPWLANVQDADRNHPGHPEYDPRTVYIPPSAWREFSPFEKQYWEIKQKFWDTIVFFKKGKFYELYEHDATIGHQLFDLKLTDRVNMRMVGVPEMSLDHWANQFVAKGYKIARVDQRESALGKEMRERDGKQAGKASKEEKIIRRELACVLTGGTLVNGSMLQDDLSTYCVSIKESELDDKPAFGISFIDAATGQFFMSDLVDDVEMTKFETLLAQIRPQELLLEKSGVSAKTLRILKNNTSPTTIWNYLKPRKEFWTADIACRELDASRYFVSEEGDNLEAWPKALREAREKELVMSSFGALTHYLRTLQIERELLTLGNVHWYDPIKKASSLILDGKTLINLEVFANSFDGGAEGTLFHLLNRCITPFGKRMFKQWVCHPLTDPMEINARLDAVDSLNADPSVRDRFHAQLSKLPDLERMISRIHAGTCKAQDFVKVLDGFEQIDYTMSLIRNGGVGEGIVGQLISGMPDLKDLLNHWKEAFDHPKARDEGLLIPERGVEQDFDLSQNKIETILGELETLLKKVRKEFGSTAICYRDNGKEIYQLEMPIKVKGIPKTWDQMSATQKVKRYYSPELRVLVRKLQEAQESHGQIVKEVSGRFFARFDEDYSTWLAAVRIIAHLDCLISLSKASATLGSPSCRPEFLSPEVDNDRSVIDFTDLRHPCLVSNITDFIPNDIRLGGDSPNISLLTGANAAGKSTVLRMTCVAVIMAQMGCYVPACSARMTPVDRIMSRLGANDNIFAAQSTFLVELAETKKILSEATPRSLVILDELGRGTSSYDGVAVAQACLHHIATHVGCVGFFATHYHSLAEEFDKSPEIRNMRMQIHVDEEQRRVTFLYKLEDGVAEGSFGMHCASMCGIPSKVIERAEVAAKEWEHTSRLKESLEVAKQGCFVPLGLLSDVAWLLREDEESRIGNGIQRRGIEVLRRAVEAL